MYHHHVLSAKTRNWHKNSGKDLLAKQAKSSQPKQPRPQANPMCSLDIQIHSKVIHQFGQETEVCVTGRV